MTSTIRFSHLSHLEFPPQVVYECVDDPLLLISYPHTHPLPLTVSCVSRQDAKPLLKALVFIIKTWNPMQVDEFKIQSKLFGTGFITAKDYFNNLVDLFGERRSIVLVPCMLQLQTIKDKQTSLLNVINQYQNSIVQKENIASSSFEDPPLEDRNSYESDKKSASSGISSLLSPSVAFTRQARKRTTSHLISEMQLENIPDGHVPFMKGKLNVTLNASREQLDEGSGKFFTVKEQKDGIVF